MNEAWRLAAAAAGGAVLGASFFLGLWWTVREIASGRRPAWWFAASFAMRLAIVGGGLWFIGRGRPTLLLAAALGFLAARLVAVRLVRVDPKVPHAS